jgi:hypothetical protein
VSGVSTNWQILTRDKALWNYWNETIYGPNSLRTLDEDAEVWSAPTIEEEMYKLNIKNKDEVFARDMEIV